MKTFLFALILSASSAYASENVIIDIPAGNSRGSDDHSARFIINQNEGTATAVLSVDREHESCHSDGDGGRDCTTWYSHILGKTVVIEGMKVVDKQVTFEDRIDCGKMGVSRIFKVPTFFLSGNCKLDVERIKVGAEKRIVVKLLIKE